jgi:Exo-beta-D-glucosaminidase Ig-fold domain/Concanavalin A-like lectin/glucanases superfamily/Glycosyl hydrolases family 2/Glycosyl hydrolases family 2, TIM barrel domain
MPTGYPARPKSPTKLKLQGKIPLVSRFSFFLLSLVAGATLRSAAQIPPTINPPEYGPYNAFLLPDGPGLRYPMTPLRETPSPGESRRAAEAAFQDSLLQAASPWTLSAWYNPAEAVTGRELLAGIGDITGEYPRFLALEPGKVVLWMGPGNALSAPLTSLNSNTWHLLAATFDGSQMRLYSDGAPVAHGLLTTGTTNAVLQVGPSPMDAGNGVHFGGKIAGFLVRRDALNDAQVEALFAARPDFSALTYEEGSKPWPLQSRGQAGYRAPQDPATLPKSRAPLPAKLPAHRAAAEEGEALHSSAPGEWVLAKGWMLQEAPQVTTPAPQIASPGFVARGWMPATVPGTVLESMIQDGVYPDPDYGLNNLVIPERLNKQDYWYRNEFPAPGAFHAGQGSRVELCFAGINYRAEIWLNGVRLGTMKGAFERGVFDVTGVLKPHNVLAVRVSPPPHPGIPQEQSMSAGPGENGGSMEIDGPAFLATEGWDWIPAIRDRNTGLWQAVTLKITRNLKIGDPRVVSTFPQHVYNRATLAIDVPITNYSQQPVSATLRASAEGIALQKTMTLPPGESNVKLTAAEFPQLVVASPRLWWPNGYGKPELYHLKLQLGEEKAAAISDQSSTRFGIREVSYELSLLDSTGHLRRLEYTPADAQSNSRVVDVSHEGMREIPSADAAALHIPEGDRTPYSGGSHVSSIVPGMENSPALRPLQDARSAPYLIIRINGVRIAARGGNWGMDDSRKRVSRERLEPYFRLHRDANVNLIRNWVGQSTEETFFDLADEYGLMVWNDFWESTQNYNIEAEDPALFLDNAADTIKHFRNHPSIIVWCGRNEGVPQPILNMGLDDLTRTLDGTRFYSPSSNQVNLQNSGPYKYQDPKLYYTEINRGFSVETGTPSMSTLESFKSTTPQADWWPVDDVWAYHDWHQSGNGAVQPFMQEMEKEFGAPTSLEDFERKAQMLNYVDHRAIFEGMNANLWSPNSGRMLWMTQPAWPSTMWQILSADYDTQASFYGTKAGCEPLHVQLNLANGTVDVINTTPGSRPGLKVRAQVFSLANASLLDQTQSVDLAADDMAHAMRLDLAALEGDTVVLVVLDLTGADGVNLSHNVYSLAQRADRYRALSTLNTVTLKLGARADRTGDGVMVRVQMANPGQTVSLANKLTLLDAQAKQRVLPAYYSDNYIALLPGETRMLNIEVPASAVNDGSLTLALRGWNTTAISIPVKVER